MKKYFVFLLLIFLPVFMQAQKTLQPKPIKVKNLNSNTNVLQPKEIKNNAINKQAFTDAVKLEEKKVETVKVVTEEKKTPVLDKELFIPKSYIYDKTKDKKVKGTIYSDGSLFCYQVSAYKSEKIAKNEKDKLKKKGFTAYVQEYKQTKKPTWYRVRIGDFDTLEEAEVSLKTYNKTIKK